MGPCRARFVGCEHLLVVPLAALAILALIEWRVGPARSVAPLSTGWRLEAPSRSEERRVGKECRL